MPVADKGYIEYDDLFAKKVSDYSRVGSVSAMSVLKHTGKDWEKWVSILEDAGADQWSHREIVAYLKSRYRKLTPWWQQIVATGFEIACGRRKPGQDLKGKYMASITKTMACPASEVWKGLVSGEGQRHWLDPLAEVGIRKGSVFETGDGFFGEVRTLVRARRMRLFWRDPEWDKHTVVEVHLVPRPQGKSILVFNHSGLPDSRTKDRIRTRWRKSADGFAEWLLESRTASRRARGTNR